VLQALCVMAMLSTAPDTSEAARPAAETQANPPEGVALAVRRGFFTETDIGTFFTLGGEDQYSNAQSYLQLGVGYDVSDKVELAFHVGVGANAANCFGGKVSGRCAVSDNFTLTFLDLSVGYLLRVAERLYVTPKLVGGYTLMDPAPMILADGTELTSGPNAGLGLGLEYATHMDHFTVGLDTLVRFVPGPDIPTIAIFPRVKYTF
jgi:hypothetical protein